MKMKKTILINFIYLPNLKSINKYKKLLWGITAYISSQILIETVLEHILCIFSSGNTKGGEYAN